MTEEKAKDESVPSRIRPWAHQIIENIAKQRSDTITQLEKKLQLHSNNEDEMKKINNKISNIKTSYVDIASELILIGSSNLIDSGLEYYVEGERATLSYD